jgi:hypothetical protein
MRRLPHRPLEAYLSDAIAEDSVEAQLRPYCVLGLASESQNRLRLEEETKLPRTPTV